MTFDHVVPRFVPALFKRVTNPFYILDFVVSRPIELVGGSDQMKQGARVRGFGV